MTVVLALLLDALLGEPRAIWDRVPHPAVLMGRAVDALDLRLNDRTRGMGVLAVAILAVGAIKLQPWVHKGKVKPRQVTTLALSFDHRLVDGELGSKVLADVAAILEQPKRLITWA